MKNLKLFWHFFKESVLEIMANKYVYLSAFLALVFLGNVESLYSLLGISEESTAYIALTVLVAILTYIVLSQIVLIQKKKHGGEGELSFFVPTFLLYNLYYSFLFFLGLALFILPGLYALVFFSMVPFIAVLDDEVDGKFFKRSRELVKRNVGLVAWASFLSLIAEASGFLLSPIQDPGLKVVVTFLFSIPDSFITMALTIATVKVYYFLKNN